MKTKVDQVGSQEEAKVEAVKVMLLQFCSVTGIPKERKMTKTKKRRSL